MPPGTWPAAHSTAQQRASDEIAIGAFWERREREREGMGNAAELVFVKWKGGKNKIQVSVELCQNEIGYVQLSPNHTLVLVVHSHMAEWQVA